MSRRFKACRFQSTFSFLYGTILLFSIAFVDSQISSIKKGMSLAILVNGSNLGKLSGNYAPNITTGNYSFYSKLGSADTFTSVPRDLGLWSTGDPTVITITIRRVGCITLTGDTISAVAATSPDTVEVTLMKFSHGFLFNRLVPPEKLANINPFQPLS